MVSCFIITIIKHNNNYIVYLNYYVEKKSETLSKRALQASKDQMSMVVSTNAEVTCNLQAGSSEYFSATCHTHHFNQPKTLLSKGINIFNV